MGYERDFGLNLDLLKKISPKQGLKQLELELAKIREATELLDGSPAARSERMKKVRGNTAAAFWFFATTYLPHWFACKSAEIHYELIDELLDEGVLAVRWPRGFAKTTILQAYGLWRLLTGKSKFAVYIGKGKTVSDEIVSAMIFELAANRRIEQDFGEQLTDQASMETGFRLMNGSWLMPISPLLIRGRKKGEHRPDLIVADDIEDSELVRNRVRVRQLIKWWLQDVIPACGDRFTAVWLGTSLAGKSALSLLLDPEWSYGEAESPPNLKRISRPAKNADGQSVWPEKWPVERLDAVRTQIGATAFNQEYMHLAEMTGGRFNEGWFVKIKPDELPVGLATALIVDPVAKDKALKSKDTTSILGMGRDIVKNQYYFLHATLKRITGEALVKKLFDLHAVYHFRFWIFETQTFAILYRDMIFKEAKARGNMIIPLIILEQKVPKDLRILSLQPVAEQGRFHWMPGHSDQNELIEQFIYYGNTGTPDDGPDTVEMGYNYLSKLSENSGDFTVRHVKKRLNYRV